MTKSTTALRATIAVAFAGAATVAASGVATASPIDLQPTPLLCAAGIAPLQSVTHTEQEAVEAEELLYVVNQQGGAGGTINWFNLTNGSSGNASFSPAEGWHNIPVALVEPEAGTVVSVVWGPYKNAADENCFLLPGLDLAEVPGEPGDPD
ncbi:hypothetical protein ACFWDA_13945 [Rhodococcus zopfii]|uniref:hypothetical protein n=1 Tax=Rhodococcus zopfii TaxID=43772 RepID=UPI000934BE3B|nr:hypothetical protein [Rhodococcus zopfii]